MMKSLACLIISITVLLSVTKASSQQIEPGLRGFWTLNVERSDFGARPKPKMGFVNWGEHGWTFAIVTADGRLYADAVSTDSGCALIGVFSNCSCEVEVVSPRHVRFTLKQGAAVRQVGDIELLENDTTQTSHRVTPAEPMGMGSTSRASGRSTAVKVAQGNSSLRVKQAKAEYAKEHIWELRDVRIRVIGNVGVVMSHIHVKKRLWAGSPSRIAHPLMCLKKRAGRWQLVAEQMET
jgi:hypothetical protein